MVFMYCGSCEVIGGVVWTRRILGVTCHLVAESRFLTSLGDRTMGVGSAISALGKCSSKGLGSNGLAGWGGSGKGCLSGDGRGGGAGGGGRSVNWALSWLKLM